MTVTINLMGLDGKIRWQQSSICLVANTLLTIQHKFADVMYPGQAKNTLLTIDLERVTRVDTQSFQVDMGQCTVIPTVE